MGWMSDETFDSRYAQPAVGLTVSYSVESGTAEHSPLPSVKLKDK